MKISILILFAISLCNAMQEIDFIKDLKLDDNMFCPEWVYYPPNNIFFTVELYDDYPKAPGCLYSYDLKEKIYEKIGEYNGVSKQLIAFPELEKLVHVTHEKVCIYDLKNKFKCNEYPIENVSELAFDGKYLALVRRYNTHLVIYNLTEDTPKTYDMGSQIGQVNNIFFKNDSLIVISQNLNINIWSLKLSSSENTQIEHLHLMKQIKGKIFKCFGGTLNNIIYYGCSQNEIYIIDSFTWDMGIINLPVQAYNASLSRDKSFFLILDKDSKLHIFDLTTGTFLENIAQAGNTVYRGTIVSYREPLVNVFIINNSIERNPLGRQHKKIKICDVNKKLHEEMAKVPSEKIIKNVFPNQNIANLLRGRELGKKIRPQF